MKEDRLFEVKHQERPTVQVRAVDRLRAISAAAREWGDRWTEIARDCEVSDLGPALEQSGNGGLRVEQYNRGKDKDGPARTDSKDAGHDRGGRRARHGGRRPGICDGDAGDGKKAGSSNG